MANEKSMYVIQCGHTVELRQARYRAQHKAGREHPHDLCAIARTVEELRSMVDVPGRWHGDVDWSAVECQPQPDAPAYVWRTTRAGSDVLRGPNGRDCGQVYRAPSGRLNAQAWREGEAGAPMTTLLDHFSAPGASDWDTHRAMVEAALGVTGRACWKV